MIPDNDLAYPEALQIEEEDDRSMVLVGFAVVGFFSAVFGFCVGYAL